MGSAEVGWMLALVEPRLLAAAEEQGVAFGEPDLVQLILKNSLNVCVAATEYENLLAAKVDPSSVTPIHATVEIAKATVEPAAATDAVEIEAAASATGHKASADPIDDMARSLQKLQDRLRRPDWHLSGEKVQSGAIPPVAPAPGQAKASTPKASTPKASAPKASTARAQTSTSVKLERSKDRDDSRSNQILPDFTVPASTAEQKQVARMVELLRSRKPTVLAQAENYQLVNYDMMLALLRGSKFDAGRAADQYLQQLRAQLAPLTLTTPRVTVRSRSGSPLGTAVAVRQLTPTSATFTADSMAQTTKSSPTWLEAGRNKVLADQAAAPPARAAADNLSISLAELENQLHSVRSGWQQSGAATTPLLSVVSPSSTFPKPTISPPHAANGALGIDFAAIQNQAAALQRAVSNLDEHTAALFASNHPADELTSWEQEMQRERERQGQTIQPKAPRLSPVSSPVATVSTALVKNELPLVWSSDEGDELSMDPDTMGSFAKASRSISTLQNEANVGVGRPVSALSLVWHSEDEDNEQQPEQLSSGRLKSSPSDRSTSGSVQSAGTVADQLLKLQQELDTAVRSKKTGFDAISGEDQSMPYAVSGSHRNRRGRTSSRDSSPSFLVKQVKTTSSTRPSVEEPKVSLEAASHLLSMLDKAVADGLTPPAVAEAIRDGIANAEFSTSNAAEITLQAFHGELQSVDELQQMLRLLHIAGRGGGYQRPTEQRTPTSSQPLPPDTGSPGRAMQTLRHTPSANRQSPKRTSTDPSLRNQQSTTSGRLDFEQSMGSGERSGRAAVGASPVSPRVRVSRNTSLTADAATTVAAQPMHSPPTSPSVGQIRPQIAFVSVLTSLRRTTTLQKVPESSFARYRRNRTPGGESSGE